jgi:hypothetical protein
MTVIVNKTSERLFKAHEVLWAKRELINAVVEAALINQTEGFIEMIMDGQEDLSRDGINATLRGVKESTEDLLGDMMSDFESMLRERLKAVNYGAAVTGMKYDLAGTVTDIEVSVSVTDKVE